ncbi:MAG: hypothetical protein V4649_05510 [Bacteroidota bacterium]
MSHDTHHSHSKENKTVISFKNSFWLVVIIVGLFVAALNFIQAQSGTEGAHGTHDARQDGAHGKLMMESNAGHTGSKSDIHQPEAEQATEANGAATHEAGVPDTAAAHHPAH